MYQRTGIRDYKQQVGDTLCGRLFVRLFVRSFLRSFVPSLLRSFVRSSFLRSFVSFVRFLRSSSSSSLSSSSSSSSSSFIRSLDSNKIHGSSSDGRSERMSGGEPQSARSGLMFSGDRRLVKQGKVTENECSYFVAGRSLLSSSSYQTKCNPIECSRRVRWSIATSDFQWQARHC